MDDVLNRLKALLQEVESSDPIDFADLPFNEDALRDTALHGVLAQFAALSRDGLGSDDIHTVYLVTTAKLVLENLVLQIRLLGAQGRAADIQGLSVEQVLSRFRLNRS